MGAGCGGSSSGEAPESLTKAEFIKQGDSICERIDREQAAALKAFTEEHPKVKTSKPEQEEAVKEAGLPPISAAVDKLAELGVPSGDEAEVEAIVQGLEKAVAEAEKDPSGVLGGAANPFKEVNALAKKYGFKVCSNAL